MRVYYASRITSENGVNEIHDAECDLLPRDDDRYYLGAFRRVEDALAKAANIYIRAELCRHCCRTAE